jgi:hypothetical protein
MSNAVWTRGVCVHRRILDSRNPALGQKTGPIAASCQQRLSGFNKALLASPNAHHVAKAARMLTGPLASGIGAARNVEDLRPGRKPLEHSALNWCRSILRILPRNRELATASLNFNL